MGKRTFAGLLASILFLSLCMFSPPVVEEARGGSLSGWKFCIDPGHGGGEPGAVGPGGLQEKNVNLQVALYLRDLLQAEGAEVLMTRTTDVYVSIADRYNQANAWGAHRFISVHHNAMADLPAVNGTETWVHQYASADSLQLANSVQAELVGELGLSNRGVKRTVINSPYDFGVLKNTTMPAILTEASFISNPQEEQRLRDPSYLYREAMAIMRGIHVPSSISFILPQENRVSSEEVEVSLQLLGADTVSKVDLLLDGKLIQSVSSAPFAFHVDTSDLADGTYRLEAVAWYGSGGSASVSRDFIVANAAKKWYFAEGTTREGFEEWLTVLNPNLQAVDFTVTYAFEGSEVLPRKYRVEAESRLSIEVSMEVGVGRDMSVTVDSPLPIMVERPMYFTYQGKWAGGHVSSGTNQPSRNWYFAEGYTAPGFEEWLCLLNPGEQPAQVEIEYLSQGGLIKKETEVVEPWRRATVFVNERVGTDLEISMRVTSDQPVVAERPMYFDYQGKWAGGHVSSGTNQPSSNWYFAEGYTGAGFQEWLCLFNPNPEPNRVRITYQTSEGANIADEETVPPLSRRTVDVNVRAGKGLSLSVAVAGERPLVAERPIYHDYNGWCEGGDVGIGMSKPSRQWYFAEGYTGAVFEDWLCLQNPGDGKVEAQVRFHLESGEVLWENVSLPPTSRTTLYVNSMLPYEEGMGFSIHASGDIIVERPLYFNYRGNLVGGHVSSGYAPGVER